MKHLFLLGSNISYSLSPAMHNAALLATGFDWRYELWDLPAESLPDAIAHLRTNGCIGANATILYKEAVIEWLDELGASARRVRRQYYRQAQRSLDRREHRYCRISARATGCSL